MNVKPEIAGMTDKRIAESGFNAASVLRKSVQIVADAKTLRLNRGQMFKNARLEHSYEPVVTTKQVNNVLAPEIDLPALRQSFKTNIGETSCKTKSVIDPLNILTHQTLPKYQSYLTKEDASGSMTTIAQQKNFRRKAFISHFVDKEHSAKNHKEFISA